MSDETKVQWQSSAIQGGIVAAVCSVLALSGHVVDPATQSFLTSSVTQVAAAIGTAIGGVVAVQGRFKADKKIG